VRLEETGGSVDVGALPVLQADPLQMRRLFQNLISNSLKFHRNDLPPSIRIVSEAATEGAYTIRVEDNGIGFEPGQEERIFKVFHRLHGRGEYEGAGIGLAVCRRIAERHGGELRAEGRPGEGAVFILNLPARQKGGS
jgi:light-regulated signal transduction histidine kinase (bacteriophytochrome)